ncbi:MAG: Arc family DNA-binding protein [Moraxella sp.]|nr:Arc family DNA-binding protein [Moraxella sp.]
MNEIVQVNFRMPQDLKDRLEQSAKENGRSITSELVIRLESSFKPPTQAIAPSSIDNITLSDIMREIKSLKGATP